MRAAVEASMLEIKEALKTHEATINFNILKMLAALMPDNEYFKLLRNGEIKIPIALSPEWSESTAIVKVIDDPTGRYRPGNLVETNAQTALDMIINGHAVYGEV